VLPGVEPTERGSVRQVESSTATLETASTKINDTPTICDTPNKRETAEMSLGRFTLDPLEATADSRATGSHKLGSYAKRKEARSQAKR